MAANIGWVWYPADKEQVFVTFPRMTVLPPTHPREHCLAFAIRWSPCSEQRPIASTSFGNVNLLLLPEGGTEAKVYDNNRHTLTDLNNFVTIGMSEYRVVKLSDIKHAESIRPFTFCSIFRFAGNKICNFKPQLEKCNINISKFKL
jgi:hypothetical protein